ncbi:RRQRL motif-containing zinc-binding protein [Nonomuraea endophytica]|uniref:RRQRL motif-containing zinc-binding protein n=1 Tax=Nonomuraea endophytica TaxID=714136 RepID=UPI0037C59E00
MSRRSSSVFLDPDGVTWGIPTWPWGLAPAELATLRQLKDRGLRPGGQDPVGQVMWHSGKQFWAKGLPFGYGIAYLYRIDLARPRRTPTQRQLEALAKALRVRRTCSQCGTEFPYCLPRRYGRACQPCHGWEVGHLMSPSTSKEVGRA